MRLYFLVEVCARREQLTILLFDSAGGGHIFGILMAAVTAIGVQHFVPSTDFIVYIATPAPTQPLAE
jgi:hypothetical protein